MLSDIISWSLLFYFKRLYGQVLIKHILRTFEMWRCLRNGHSDERKRCGRCKQGLAYEQVNLILAPECTATPIDKPVPAPLWWDPASGRWIPESHASRTGKRIGSHIWSESCSCPPLWYSDYTFGWTPLPSSCHTTPQCSKWVYYILLCGFWNKTRGHGILLLMVLDKARLANWERGHALCSLVRWVEGCFPVSLRRSKRPGNWNILSARGRMHEEPPGVESFKVSFLNPPHIPAPAASSLPVKHFHTH